MVDNCKGDYGFERGHNLREGKTLKGGSLGTVAARNKAVELD